jgi:hypothetical protein
MSSTKKVQQSKKPRMIQTDDWKKRNDTNGLCTCCSEFYPGNTMYIKGQRQLCKDCFDRRARGGKFCSHGYAQ